MDKNRPKTTLFMLSSVDGKISTGDKDIMDTDTDFRKIVGIKEGLGQYYALEKKTDMHFLITGKVMAKKCKQLNVNSRKDTPDKIPASGVIVDNKHLNKNGVKYLAAKLKKMYLVTANKNHPGFKLKDLNNLEIIYYEKNIEFSGLFKKLKKDYKINKITIQSGGTLNAVLLREKLIDHVSLVLAPCLMGGANTSTLIDGESLHAPKELKKIKALKLIRCKVLKNSYIHLSYDVINNTKIIYVKN